VAFFLQARRTSPRLFLFVMIDTSRLHFDALGPLLDYGRFRMAFQNELAFINKQKMHLFSSTPLLRDQWDRWTEEIAQQGGADKVAIEHALGGLCFYLCSSITVSTQVTSFKRIEEEEIRKVHELIITFKVQYFSITFCSRVYGLAAAKIMLPLFPPSFSRLETLCLNYFLHPEASRYIIFDLWPWTRGLTLWDFASAIHL
jgi:hypothetical protein